MAVLPSRPLNPSRMNTLVRKQPLFFGVPFIVLMVATSFGLSAITQTKYDLRDQRVKQVTKEQELKLKHDRKKFDIREEYRLNAQPTEDWDMKRVPRPNGTPEWGVPPPEPGRQPKNAP
ncbi:cytochrome c oxidase assembly protein COX16-domain-containing protein [Mycena albidolilacea]|uniref:Cytochrome c oxidase assembly protein COX16, mitochondrial n=1 Tax=Mycena albidolilacea TaxID=1033008 RepID=A0AAD7AR34_9AGAR|nr:cytochrome c oxidase assembly protein COX16-domain-containing protein [Mycena albidolilacea]